MEIGAHVSAAGGVWKAVERATEIGAEAIQLFASSPRGWRFKPISEADSIRYLEAARNAGIESTFLHGIYLVNLGGTPDLVEKSVDSLTNHLQFAAMIRARGVIFHSGSHKGQGFDNVFEQVVSALRKALAEIPPDVDLIIENCAGMGDQIGASFEQIGRMIEAVEHPSLKVCIDTEHAFAAGYDLVSLEGIERAMDEFDREIGLDRLAVVHANDAKVEFGSGVDRHENIGEGYIGLDGFKTIIGHPAFRSPPFLLEVPGPDKKGPDKENIDRLKSIRDGLSS